jgi:hypothetical protein
MGEGGEGCEGGSASGGTSPGGPPWPGAGRRARGLSAALPLFLALGSIAWFFWILNRGVEAADLGRIDARRSRLDAGGEWIDPRWSGELSQRLALLGEIRCDDRAAIERLRAELSALPFVAGVGEPEVLWPDGLRVPVEVRRGAACVLAGVDYLAVSADGVVLSGRWPAPPARESGFLPLLAAEAGAAELRPGELASEPSLAGALAVARSMWTHLEGQDLARLGRAVIDARAARRASVEEPGCVLLLEHGRRVLFGRTPDLDAPGELPVEAKWASLSRALRLLDPGPDELDWELVDVRWDVPELLPRGGLAEREGFRARERRGGG